MTASVFARRCVPSPLGARLDGSKRASALQLLSLLRLLLVLLACSCSQLSPNDESVSRAEQALAAAASDGVFDFEDATKWSVVQGAVAPPVASRTASEGAFSLSLSPSGYVVLRSEGVPVRSALTGSVSYDLFVPTEQANAYWFGATQLYLNCPSRGVFNAYLGQVELTTLQTGRFHTLSFNVPPAVLSGLSQGCEDLSFSIALVVPSNQTASYLLDNLEVATAGDLLSPHVQCVFQRAPNRYFARFSYLNASSSSLSVPVGAENSFGSESSDVGQPQAFLSGDDPEEFTLPFDGTPLTWRLGRSTAVASPDSPACPSAWLPAWLGRGPLSTTITTNGTSNDSVPNLSGRTLRVMAHLTAGGSQVRVRFSQRFSTSSLAIEAAHVALRSSGSSIVPETDRALSFDGSPSVSVPAGEDVWSDPVALDVAGGQDLAISVYMPDTFVPTTEGGRGGTKTSYYKTGNAVAEAAWTRPSSTRGVFVAYEVQVLSQGPSALIAALGDSITEGACSAADANGDWPDLLAARLPWLADGTAIAVANAGIGSGRFAASDGAGLRGLKRLEELLTLPAVRWVTLLMGVNDISYEHVSASFLEEAYAEAISKAHAAGKMVIGIPILPFGNSTKDVGDNKQVAQEANAWIRAHDLRLGASEPSFDAVVDLEPVLGDSNDPDWALRSALTCDRVHPNQAGYTAIANAFPLDIFN